MVFDLEIQTAHKPADKFILRRKIGRCLQLVYRPFVFQLTCFFVRHREMRVFDSMCQLEHDTEYKSGYQRKNKETNHPGNKAQHIDGDRYENEKIEKFE